MSYKISTDIGGTFTDVCVVDDMGQVNIFKSLTTYSDYLEGILNGLNLAANYYCEDLTSFMSKCVYFGHGTTVATNALIERKTAKVGLICTYGHRDVLYYREAGKDNPFRIRYDYPEAYVPRYLTLPVTERIDAQGGVVTPLDEKEVREAVRQLKQYDVKVIAVSLLFSFVNPAHENRIAEIIENEWPGVQYTLSHMVNPIIREYRRAISTAIDASLKPLVSKYIGAFEKRLKGNGYKGVPYMLTSFGGITTPEEIIKRPVYIVDSGPALAPVAGLFYAEKELNINNVLTCDMGGTSFDVSRVTNGIVSITQDAMVENERIGVHKVDCRSIGAGGGSICWVDKGGLLHVGPQGAKSEPGPACYMRGGKDATVTDANLILGYLDENYFLGGNMKVDKSHAIDAVNRNVAGPLGLDAIEGAFAIWNTVTVNMTEAIRNITLWEGIDPRDYVVVVGGGATALHAASIVEQLGAKKIIIPKTASTLSAFGGVIADIVSEFSRSYFTTSKDLNKREINEVLYNLKVEAELFLDKVGVPAENRVIEFYVEARYPFQERELRVALTKDKFEDDNDITRLVEGFHAIHEQTLGSKEEGQYIECTLWKVRAIGITESINLPEIDEGSEIAPDTAMKLSREAYFKELGGMVTVQVYDGDKVLAGNKIVGPAIIEESTTTIIIPPKCISTVSKYGNYIIDIE